ncbi:uncharacterized protein BT62DRAFT_928942 [Guyanagaster necrorhizus]|uniref:Pentatricopeptide repeat-containing protein n=1 Tax=Guyanagaster necrorhizus TaxID=856835 RepID=A0A9P7VWQ3_9AGAR|nr:uncharacterized protein BT62DRAFT_928942 [Guyanagaster necrorhizus MCA 3950]KAG7448936.1 hypothetical protein BT62DRAFT_928942 [Guyanagaster necrorhizus MCA 3950]
MLKASSLSSTLPSSRRALRICYLGYIPLVFGWTQIRSFVRPTDRNVEIIVDAQERKKVSRKYASQARLERSTTPGKGGSRSVTNDSQGEYVAQMERLVRDPPSYPAPPYRRLPLKPLQWGIKKKVMSHPRCNFPHSASEDEADGGEGQDITPPNPDIPYYHHLHVLASTQSETEAWASYTQLLKLPAPESFPENIPIPFPNLHRLCRLLSRSKPKNRTLFLRLLSVMYLIYRSGGQLQVFHWNALIDCAGKGLRKPRMEDFKLALDVFTDMITGKPPGATYSPSEYRVMSGLGEPIQPDIITYTTLLNIAAKTLQGHALRQAISLLRSSGLSPNRITHLCLMAYYTSTRDLNGIRGTLIQMHSRGLELGIDGVNSCMWAFAHRRLDIVRDIYRILRHSISPEPNVEEIASLKQKLQEEETILIPEGMRPNKITFTSMVQCMSYNGDLDAALDTFYDMMTTDNVEVGAVLQPNTDGMLKPVPYNATHAIYRAFFLGFARHGDHMLDGLASRLQQKRPWSFDALQSIYDTFIIMPGDDVPTKTTIYWLMVAFNKVSGRDLACMRQVWTEMVERFHGPWGGPDNRLQRMHRSLALPDEEAGKYLQELEHYSDNSGGWRESDWL